MVTPTVARGGHSLAELLVALTLLGIAVGAAGATSALGARMASQAAARQQAGRAAMTVLDSLVRLPLPPVSGRRPGPHGGIATWHVELPDTGGLRGVRVRVEGPTGEIRCTLTSVWAPPPGAVEG